MMGLRYRPYRFKVTHRYSSLRYHSLLLLTVTVMLMKFLSRRTKKIHKIFFLFIYLNYRKPCQALGQAKIFNS